MITASPAPKLEENFPIETEGFPDFKMGFNEFSAINSHFRFPIQLVKALNQRFADMIDDTGRVVCTDEKHRKVQIGWKHARFAKNKNGHWITQTALLGPTTALPILTLLQPTTSVSNLKFKNEPYNNIPVSEQLINAFEVTSNHSIHIADSYYPDTLGMRALNKQDSLYMFKVSPLRFKELFERAKELMEKAKLRAIGDFIVLYSEATNEHFMMYISEKLDQKKGYKRKSVLTNAFEQIKAPTNYIGPNTISIAFREYFNPCDRANSRMNAFEWPYKRNGWKSSYDDFFFQSTLLNIYTCYHEAHALIGEANHLNSAAYLRMLSTSLLRSINV